MNSKNRKKEKNKYLIFTTLISRFFGSAQGTCGTCIGYFVDTELIDDLHEEFIKLMDIESIINSFRGRPI